MRAAFLKRFSGSRLAKIIGWTTAAITWGAVALSSSLSDSNQAQATPPEPAQSQRTPPISTVPRQEVESFPEEPEGGLVILRGVPVEVPEPATVVRRVVVQSSAPAVSPAPRTQESSGS